jgi:hypothetical protein
MNCSAEITRLDDEMAVACEEYGRDEIGLREAQARCAKIRKAIVKHAVDHDRVRLRQSSELGFFGI